MINNTFFDKTYTNSEHPWGVNPARVVEDYSKFFQPQGTIIDLGAGDGRNAIFLGKQGFEILAIDFNQKALDILNSNAIGLDVTTQQADLASYDPPSHDGLLAFFVLHFLPKVNAEQLLRKAIQTAKPGAIHILSDFIPKQTNLKWLSQKELTQLYRQAGWQVVLFSKIKQKTLNGELAVTYELVASNTPRPITARNRE